MFLLCAFTFLGIIPLTPHGPDIVSDASQGRSPTAGAPDENATIATAIYAALREIDPNAFIQGDPGDGPTIIDGTFDLNLLAGRIARSMASDMRV